MNIITGKIFIIVLLCTVSLSAQFDDKQFGIGINGVYTTSAKIYLTPFSSDPVLRNNSFPLEDIFNPSIDFRYRLSEPLVIGLSLDYISATDDGPNLTVFDGTSTRTIFVEDGFILIPVELSVYYILPFSTEDIKFFMGGGAGYYFGEHVRKAGDVSVSNVDRKAAFGINVSAGLDYLIYTNTFAHFEMKFRDPQFTVRSKYDSRIINYEGRTLTLSQDEFDSKINIDGVVFMLGLFFQF